jgi:uncharacterized membrane protein
MKDEWDSHLEQWTSAGLIDTDTASRVREWEARQAPSHGLQWPVLLALAFGALLLGAGVLLFVSAHWDDLSAVQRMTLVVLLVAIFHVGGAIASKRFEGLSIALHTLGTIALGAGIALTGQIFHLSEHWPAAILLWAVGAAVAWAVLRHWTQAALAAILFPTWLAGEWSLHTSFTAPIAAGICALSFTYLTALRDPSDGDVRRALVWLGAIALIPSAILIAVEGARNGPPWQQQAFAWLVVVVIPLALAIVLRGREAIWNAAAIAWVLLLVLLTREGDRQNIAVYAWCALGGAALAGWGVRDARPERINLGIAAFALTVLFFYFSSVMDKLGRSASLIILGIVFLGGGWLLERTRRRLIARIHPEPV